MGRYRYTQRIGRGGMAQVFLAMQEGIGGFEKPVVIKRIFPHLCEDEHFIRMFLDEARLAATVRHPNVVEIFDIGQDQEGYFIVMEYLCGETLAFMAHTLSKQGLALPPHIGCRVLASVAAGLHHAHTVKDASGKPQPVVHRDVTPSNLLVCYNGAVKIVDFGVAKAVSSAEDTKGGAIKGKLAYLAPEQIQRKPVDARTDIFQLGIVLHELLSGRRLFSAASEHGKLQAVLTREVPPPSSLNPAVPAHVDHIVLRALERDPSKRPASADELRGLLEGALKVMGETVTDHALGAWMQDAFSQSYADRLAMERSSAAKARDSREIWTAAAEVVPAGRMPTVDPGQHSHTPTSSGQTLRAARVATGGGLEGIGDENTGTGADDNQGRPAASHPAPNRRTRLYAAVLLIGVAALGVMVGSSRHGGERAVVVPIAAPSPAETADAALATARTYPVAITAIPNHATIELDGQLAGAGSLIRDLPRDSSTHVLLISAPGYAQRVVTFSAARLPEPIIRLEPIVLPVEAKRSHRSSSGTGERERAGDRRSRPARSDPDTSPHTSPPPAAEPAIPTSPNTDNIDPWAQ